MQTSVCVFSFFSFCILLIRWEWKQDHCAEFPLLCLFVHILKVHLFKRICFVTPTGVSVLNQFLVALFILFLNIMSKMFMTGCLQCCHFYRKSSNLKNKERKYCCVFLSEDVFNWNSTLIGPTLLWMCPGFSWDKIRFLLSSWYSVVLCIQYENNVW